MKKTVLILFLYFSITVVYSQSGTQTLKSQVFDAETEEPLAYATVYNTTEQIGTATGLEGRFNLPKVNSLDTIIISYIGYTSDTLLVRDVPERIELQTSIQVMAELVVTPDDEKLNLFKLINDLNSYEKAPVQQSKSYYFLETFLNGTRVETLESYYNGDFKGYDIINLALKKGRIGLTDLDGRYYLSTETSKTFRYHSLFKGNYLFPDNPLSISRKKLKKIYALNLQYKTRQDGDEVFVIDFSPKKDIGDYYSGTIWLIPQKNQILKIALHIDNAQVIPFKAFGSNKIRRMDMEITKNYEYNDEYPRLTSMDFNYSVTYSDLKGKTQVANSQAFIAAYNYKELWNLPAFTFSQTIHEDYRNITLSDYNTDFWNNEKEFRLFEKKEIVDKFISENYLNQGFKLPRSKNSQLQYPYVHWDKKRLRLGQADENKIREQIHAGIHKSKRYALGVELYLDINRIDTSTVFELYTIIDPVKTYYYYFMEPEDHVFVNLYFDLMEIERRKLVQELETYAHLTREIIEQHYQEHMESYNKRIVQLVDETNHGKDRTQLEKWNLIVEREIGINNIKQFGLNNN